MRISIDATALWGHYSGIEKVIDRVVHRMAGEPRGHRIRIFVPADWSGFEEASRFEPTLAGASGPVQVERLSFPGSRRLRRILWQQLTLPRLLREGQADCVFCPANVMPLASPCPAVVFVHDLHGLRRDYTRFSNYLHYRLLLPATLHRAAAILTPTQAVREDLNDRLRPGVMARLARLGVDAAYIASPDFGADGGGSFDGQSGIPRAPYILFVGNLEQRKGLTLLVEAFAAAAGTLPHHLVIAGKDRGAHGDVTNAVARAGLTERVHLLGYVPSEQMAALYRGASLFVLPSISEGFGIPPLEAMACGTPVVAVESPAVCENLSGAAELVGASSIALSAGIARVLSDSDLREGMVVRGRLRARQFTWENTTEAVWEAINSVGSSQAP